jgi:Flp pilus assembly protein CpaB
MKFKTIIWLALAVALGTAGSRVTKRLFSSPMDGRDPATAPVTVFVAKQPLAAGTVVDQPDRFFEERTIAAVETPATALRQLHLLRGRRLVRALDAQSIATADALAEQESPDLLKKEGRQAVALPVQSLGSELILPHARADLIWTPTFTTSAEPRVLAEDLPLLAVEHRGATAIATVAARTEDAGRLNQAAAQGVLRLVLRSSRNQK